MNIFKAIVLILTNLKEAVSYSIMARTSISPEQRRQIAERRAAVISFQPSFTIANPALEDVDTVPATLNQNEYAILYIFLYYAKPLTSSDIMKEFSIFLEKNNGAVPSRPRIKRDLHALEFLSLISAREDMGNTNQGKIKDSLNRRSFYWQLNPIFLSKWNAKRAFYHEQLWQNKMSVKQLGIGKLIFYNLKDIPEDAFNGETDYNDFMKHVLVMKKKELPAFLYFKENY